MANLLHGSVQKVADVVRINVQLISAATDEHIWAESYNRKLDDIFAVESEVAGAIADTLKAELTGAEEQALAHASDKQPSRVPNRRTRGLRSPISTNSTHPP